MKKLFIVLGLLAMGSVFGFGQKYGHCNLGTLISLMPEVKAANSELEAFQKQMVAKGEEMAQKFQEKYAQFVRDVQSGTLSPKQQQEQQDALQKEQQSILDYEQEITQKVGEKRNELLNPIVEKAMKAIEEVAKENGYVMIFDTSAFNAVLFAIESDDVMPLVKARLGLE